MTTPNAALVEEIKALLKDASDGPWAYRPEEHDDWGTVKGPPHRPKGFEYDLRAHLAQFRHPERLNDEVLDRYRSLEQDPWAGDAKLVVFLRNNAEAILTALQSDAAQARVEALEFIADCPDPGKDKERSATFYRLHAAMLKQIAAKALGRKIVSDEAMAWAEEAMLEIRALKEPTQ